MSYLTLPPDHIIDAANAGITRVTARCDIYESDATTPFFLNAPITEGKVSIDQTRTERRQLDLTVRAGDDPRLQGAPEGIWYDKILKVYRGITTRDGSWEQPLGVFMVDTARSQHFPTTVRFSCRDLTKKLIQAKFPSAIEFPANEPIENIIRAIAVGGEITNHDLPLTGSNTGRVFGFEGQTTRWDAINEIATAYDWETFFDAHGVLRMRRFADPFTTIAEHEFFTGPGGNLASIEKSTSDARLYNHIVVTGEVADALPVVAEAENNSAASPARISRIGRRTYFYTSSFIETHTQAQEVANRFLASRALEQYEMQLGALAAPWLDVGIIVEVHDPRASQHDPYRYLLSSIEMPVGPGAMRVKAVRVVDVFGPP